MENKNTKTENKLVERILSEARSVASEAEAKANADAMAVSAEAVKKRNQLHKENSAKCEASVKSLIDGAQTRASLDGKKYALSLKRKLIDQAFETAYQSLCKLGASESEPILASLLKKELEGGETVIPSAADRKTIEALVSKSGCDAAVSDEDAAIERGFVVRCAGYEKDCSFRSLLSTIRETEETNVARILFE